MPKLGINIDHVATLRQARREFEPDPLTAARICVAAGADSIVAHLREDRRHINDQDIRKLRKFIKINPSTVHGSGLILSGATPPLAGRRRRSIKFNLEMSIHHEIVEIACRIKPNQATLVPERRQEITTEGGLDVIRYFRRIKRVVQKLEKSGITTSLFIDPIKAQILKSKETGAKIIELHTGKYARVKTKSAFRRELKRLSECSEFARNLGLTVNAGHGLNYQNTRPVAKIPGIRELNIGHAVISRSVFVGLGKAVKEMIRLVR